MPSITCPKCGMTSYNPLDVATGYCGNCRDYTSVGTDGLDLRPPQSSPMPADTQKSDEI